MSSTLATAMISIGSTKKTRSSVASGKSARVQVGARVQVDRIFMGILGSPPAKRVSAACNLVEGVDIVADVRRRSDHHHLRENLGLVVEEFVGERRLALLLQDIERPLIGKRPAVFEEVVQYVFGLDAMLQPGHGGIAMGRALHDAIA